MQIVQPGNLATKLSRDNLGRLVAIEQGGLTRRYAYDARGFLASEYNPETQTTSYGYDAVGNRTSRKVGAAATDLYSYDAMDRLVRITYPGNQIFTYSYDLGGRLVRQTSYQGTTWDYGYNAHDQVIAETLTLIIPQRSYTVRYGYDPRDNLHAITYPSGLVVEYAPDAYGRPTRAGTFASAIRFHPDGQLSSLTYGNGRKLAIALDTRRLRVTERLVGGADLPMRLRYAYDATGNLTQIADLQNSAYSQAMAYDASSRLISSRGFWGAATFTYNPRGDISRQNLGNRTITYSYDGQGRLAGLNGTLVARLAYDARGNTIKALGEYGFDQASQMTWSCLTPRANCAASPDERHIYDAAGRRVATFDAKSVKRTGLYGQNGHLLREDDAIGGFKEYIYVAGELVAHREQCSDIDSDFDGMPDCFEVRLGLDPTDPRDGQADSDGDGLSNADEYRLGTKLRNPDSDSDGMPDGWEFQHKLDPRNPADAHLDANGDGISNLNSYLQGKSPSEPGWSVMVPVMNKIILGN